MYYTIFPGVCADGYIEGLVSVGQGGCRQTNPLSERLIGGLGPVALVVGALIGGNWGYYKGPIRAEQLHATGSQEQSKVV
jgi:hypothetical protein